MESPKDRAFLVRLALGSMRKPMPMGAFAVVLTRAAQKIGLGGRYYPSTISDIEAGERKITLEDVQVFAAVDPLRRGESWMAFGASAQAAPADPDDLAKLNPRPMPKPHPKAAPAAKRRVVGRRKQG